MTLPLVEEPPKDSQFDTTSEAVPTARGSPARASCPWHFIYLSAPFPEDELLICPYNNSHHIRQSRMNVHIEKCKRNYPKGQMLRCDFNACHMYHHQTYPDRKKIEGKIVEDRQSTEIKFPLPAVSHVEMEENWDNACAPSYDPSQYVETHTVLRHLNTESKAKRRNFRLQERQRLAANLETVKVPLPPHRTVTPVTDDKYRPSTSAQKLKLRVKEGRLIIVL